MIQGYTKDRSRLLSKGSEVRVARLGALAAAADKVRGHLRFFASQEQSLLSIKDEVGNLRSHGAPEALRKMTERHKASALHPDEWKQLLLDYKGDVDTALIIHLSGARKSVKELKGAPLAPAADSNVALIPDDAELDDQSLALLEAEIARLEKLVGADRDTAKKFAALSRRITEETATLVRLKERLADCEGAKERVEALVQEREAAYVRVFDAIVSEEGVLGDLYSPLMTRLEAAGGAMHKLSFSVTRTADVGRWAGAGEELLEDADQIIVAQAEPHAPGELPPISYFSGGLENADIRKAVCNILEGGERAFQERARRLRVTLER